MLDFNHICIYSDYQRDSYETHILFKPLFPNFAY